MLCVGLLTLAIKIQPARAAGTIVVPDNYPTIQAAVNAASPYDTILVRSGSYSEFVSINKNNLEILGENKNSTILNGGFSLTNASYNVIANFTIIGPANDTIGITMDQSSFNTIKNNAIIGCQRGLYINYMNNDPENPHPIPESCHYNIIAENTFQKCEWSDVFFFVGFTNNTFYHNNFFSPNASSNPVDYIETFSEFFDAGYPCGGNYWGDYNGTDMYSGPYQNLTGSDGIGDTPYNVSATAEVVALDFDNYPLMTPWTGMTHDVAVMNVSPSKTVVGQGQLMTISVLVENEGDYTESAVNPQCLANGTSVLRLHMLPIALNSDYAVLLNFGWNTTGWALGNYSMSAHVANVTGETHTSDNTLTDGWVIVSIIGDITGPNGWPDYKVDMRDIALIARCFGSTPSSSNWNPNADLNNDGAVNMKDIALVARNFGNHYP
jgi:nitrous oxidase accessory protein NosD